MMALLDLQSVICRALLSRDFRAAIQRAPEEACRDYSLTPDELTAVRSLRIDQLEKNARYIDVIRLGQIRRRFQWTDRVVSTCVKPASRFYDGWLQSLTHETNWHFENAVSFARYVRTAAEDAPESFPRQLPDIAEFEFRKCSVREGWKASVDDGEIDVRFSASRSSHAALKPKLRHAVDVFSTECDVMKLIERLETEGSDPAALENDASSHEPNESDFLVVHDPSAPESVAVRRISRTSMQLLTRCDGRHSVREILREFQRDHAEHNADAVQVEVLKNIEAMSKRGWLSFLGSRELGRTNDSFAEAPSVGTAQRR